MSFFFNYTATTEIYTLSLHDALPIYLRSSWVSGAPADFERDGSIMRSRNASSGLITIESRNRSEEHTSELQSHSDLVCRLLLEKKKNRCETLTWCSRRISANAASNTN